MEIFISLGQWWANIISAAVSVINSAGMWISLEDNASAEWPCCEFSLVALWWAQRFAGAQVREEQVLLTAWPLKKEELIISGMLWSASGFICKGEAGMATAQAARTGILRYAVKQHPKGRQWKRKWAARGGRQAGKWWGKREDWFMIGEAIFPFSLNVIHVLDAVCVAHVTAIICRPEEYCKISQVSQK